MWFVLLWLWAAISSSSPAYTFSVGPEDRFWLDGKKFNIYSGSIHYARVPREYWDDRLQRIQALGLNTVQFYVPWNYHAVRNRYDFSGNRDVEYFLELCQKRGLYVLLRIGPYICGEWQFGGFPPWLMLRPVRTYNRYFLHQVDRWWGVLLPKLHDWLHVRTGGPILMVQIENEFGSYGNVATNLRDKMYMEHLLTKAQNHLGNDVVFYTTDGGNEGSISRGRIEGAYACGDGPANITSLNTSFHAMKKFNPKGRSPNFNTELYSGWLTHWTEPKMQNMPTKDLRDAVEYCVNTSASFNLYMAHGGTNFGFTAGANDNGILSEVWHVTSYDYSAPIAENGGTNNGTDGIDKYRALQAILNPRADVIVAPPCASFEKPVILTLRATRDTFADACSWRKLSTNNIFPLDVFAVFSLQRFTPKARTRALKGELRNVTCTEFADALYAYYTTSDGVQNAHTQPALALPNTSFDIMADDASMLDVVIENMGHINAGSLLGLDFKGVKIKDANPYSGRWAKCFVSPEDIDVIIASSNRSIEHDTPQPAVFSGTFFLDSVGADTYLDVGTSRKGSAFVNGHGLGRYWHVGPQKRLYIPSPFLRQGENVLSLLEFLGPIGQSQREVRLSCPAAIPGAPLETITH